MPAHSRLRRPDEEERCILANEAGLGKAIEAGLVLAQRRAEGSARRILFIVPKPLAKPVAGRRLGRPPVEGAGVRSNIRWA